LNELLGCIARWTTCADLLDVLDVVHKNVDAQAADKKFYEQRNREAVRLERQERLKCIEQSNYNASNGKEKSLDVHDVSPGSLTLELSSGEAVRLE